MRILRTVWLAVLLTVTQLASCAVVGRMFIPSFEEKATVDVNGVAPKRFPVLVVTREAGAAPSARVVYQEGLAAFLEKHPDHSFLVPQGEEERLNETARALPPPEEAHPPGYWATNFKVRTVSPGVQKFEVFGSNDDDWMNTSFYEARDKSIRPERHRFYRGPSMLLDNLHIFILLPLILNGGLWLGGRTVWRRLNEGKEPKS